jgi:hypothetical protein
VFSAGQGDGASRSIVRLMAAMASDGAAMTAAAPQALAGRKLHVYAETSFESLGCIWRGRCSRLGHVNRAIRAETTALDCDGCVQRRALPVVKIERGVAAAGGTAVMVKIATHELVNAMRKAWKRSMFNVVAPC